MHKPFYSRSSFFPRPSSYLVLIIYLFSVIMSAGTPGTSALHETNELASSSMVVDQYLTKQRNHAQRAAQAEAWRWFGRNARQTSRWGRAQVHRPMNRT